MQLEVQRHIHEYQIQPGSRLATTFHIKQLENSSEALMKYHSWSAILMSRTIHTKWVIWHSADKSNTEILDKLTPIREDNLKRNSNMKFIEEISCVWAWLNRKCTIQEHSFMHAYSALSWTTLMHKCKIQMHKIQIKTLAP